MAQGPVIIFDKSTIQTLTVDESVLLDNFYTSNIIPVFFAECLADLERDMQRAKSKGSPESLVGRSPHEHRTHKPAATSSTRASWKAN